MSLVTYIQKNLRFQYSKTQFLREFPGNDDENFTVYPNPTSGKIYIQVPASLRGIASISLIDPQGRIVLNREYQDENTIYELEYSIPGLYFLQIKPINSPPILKKIIVF